MLPLAVKSIAQNANSKQRLPGKGSISGDIARRQARRIKRRNEENKHKKYVYTAYGLLKAAHQLTYAPTTAGESRKNSSSAWLTLTAVTKGILIIILKNVLNTGKK